ncbi:MAG: formylglycine-generating enzyme family protein [Planctomycetota bacterium]|jgi:formylglycine-generating enzyme required for sulfatase activity
MENTSLTIWVIAAGLCLINSPEVVADCPSADLTGDCFVNFEDFAVIGADWLNVYDWNDVNTLADQWLTGGISSIVWVSIDEADFYGEMSKYETTNAQYCQFLNTALALGDVTVDGNDVLGASGFNSGADFVGQVYYYLSGWGYTYNGAIKGGAARINYSDGVFTVDSGFDNHPVTYVSWYGSTAFCNYYGYRLPTEGEWQAVADYDGSYTYGCGTILNNSIANYYDSTHPDGTAVVGGFGTYGYGMCDMAGNIWEWTSTVSFSYRVIRSGSWGDDGYYCTVSYRSNLNPNGTSSLIGFRVCR